MIKSILFALSISVSGPTLAYTSEAPAETAPAQADPARQNAADKVVMKLVPPGTYQRVMKDVLDSMTDGLMDQLLGMDAATLQSIDGEAVDGAASTKSLQDIAAKRDPYFRERMDISMKVMFTEMGKVMGEMEPQVREALSSIFVKRFTLTEINDLSTFLETPSGTAFGNNFMSAFTDKEMMQATFSMMPKLMEAMPQIIQKVDKATAHLPPPPKPSQEPTASNNIGKLHPQLDGQKS